MGSAYEDPSTGVDHTSIQEFQTTHPLTVARNGQTLGVIDEVIQVPGPVDVIIGNNILKNFRVTIDYPDGITYMEPYDNTDVAKSH